jgi:hypothetical protein
MQTDTHDRIADDRDPAGAKSANARDISCFRCDEQPGSEYAAEIAAPPGRPAERAMTMRDALLGGGSPWLCRSCADVLGIYGHVLGWQLLPASRDRLTAPSAGPQSRTARQVA